MTWRTTVALTLLGALLAVPALAQSPIALVGPGADIVSGSARDAGRGGWGVADHDTLAPGFLNPASLADLRHLFVYFSGYGERTRSEGDAAVRTTTRVLLPQARLALPLISGRLALHGGFDLRRSLQYDLRVPATWDVEGDTLVGYSTLTREGTLFRVPVGLSWRATSALAVGASFDFVRGPINEERTSVVTVPPSTYVANKLDQEDVLDGVTGTLSALITPPGRVSLGVTFSPGFSADLERTSSLGGVGQQQRQTFRLHLPAEYMAGLKVAFAPNWNLGVDGRFAHWSAFRGLPDWDGIVRDEVMIAAGVERNLQYLPTGHHHRLPLRAGFAWRRWAYEVGGHPVDERIFAVGTGFPFQNRLGQIDLGLSYSLAGSLADNGWSTRTWRLSISVSGLERLVF